MNTRHYCITKKVKTDFGSCYVHLDLSEDGIPIGGRITTPGKEPGSQIQRLIDTLSAGMNDALASVTGYEESFRTVLEDGN